MILMAINLFSCLVRLIAHTIRDWADSSITLSEHSVKACIPSPPAAALEALQQSCMAARSMSWNPMDHTHLPFPVISFCHVPYEVAIWSVPDERTSLLPRDQAWLLQAWGSKRSVHSLQSAPPLTQPLLLGRLARIVVVTLRGHALLSLLHSLFPCFLAHAQAQQQLQQVLPVAHLHCSSVSNACLWPGHSTEEFQALLCLLQGVCPHFPANALVRQQLQQVLPAAHLHDASTSTRGTQCTRVSEAILKEGDSTVSAGPFQCVGEHQRAPSRSPADWPAELQGAGAPAR